MKNKYKKEKIEWVRLDNASKIFPATSSNKDTKVYRIAAELYREVDAANLQRALDLTMRSFPIYKSVLRRGFFWYYFELSDIRPEVERESTNICAPLYIEGKRNLLFRVSYYKKRINLELFHALSDGAGGIWFLETLIYHYIKLNHQDEIGDNIPKLEYSASISEKMTDSFWKNYTVNMEGRKVDRKKHKQAYNIKGKRLDENRMKVNEGAMPVGDVLKVSREYGTSLTVFLASLLIYSIYGDMPRNKRDKPVVLSVPVNLRGYYNSSTARNFFTTMDISYDFKEGRSVEFKDIVDFVGKEFKKELQEENIHLKLARFMKLEQNPVARVAPLILKDFFMKIADRFNDRSISSSISNVGRIKVVEEFQDYVKQFSVSVSARNPKITFCSYKDRLVITFTSPYEETDIQRVFFQFLSSLGIKVEITSNM